MKPPGAADGKLRSDIITYLRALADCAGSDNPRWRERFAGLAADISARTEGPLPDFLVRKLRWLGDDLSRSPIVRPGDPKAQARFEELRPKLLRSLEQLPPVRLPDFFLVAGETTHQCWTVSDKHGRAVAGTVRVELDPPLWLGMFGRDGFSDSLVLKSLERSKAIGVAPQEPVTVEVFSPSGPADLRQLGRATIFATRREAHVARMRPRL